MDDLSQLQDSSPIGEIHEIEAFQKVGGKYKVGLLPQMVAVEKPFGVGDGHLYREIRSGDRVLIDADANGIPSTEGDSQQALGASDLNGRYILFTLDEYGDVDLTPGDALFSRPAL